MSPMNPTGKHRRKRRHHGEGTVVQRGPYRLKDGTLRKRQNPWAAVVPYRDEAGQARVMWLSAASKSEAEALRDAAAARIRKGIRPTSQTVGEYVSGWLETVEVGPGTWPRYRAHLELRIASFGDVPLVDLAPQMVRRALIRWPGSAQTRGGALRLLRAAMKQAVADRRIEHDPTAGIPYPKVPRHEPVTLTADEARRLMATVEGERFAPILVVSLGLGLRRGEALGLRTEDIIWEDGHGEARMGQRDRDDDIAATGRDRRSPNTRHGAPTSALTLRRDADGRPLRAVALRIAHGLRYIPPALRAEGEGPYRLTGTKTGETRELPLPDFVADALQARLAERDAERRAAKVYAPNDFVFCDRYGNSVPLQTLYAWFKGALGRAGLPDMRWHDLRATTITLLYEMDVPEAIIMAIAGHRDLQTTRLYKGRTPVAMRGAADKMGEALG